MVQNKPWCRILSVCPILSIISFSCVLMALLLSLLFIFFVVSVCFCRFVFLFFFPGGLNASQHWSQRNIRAPLLSYLCVSSCDHGLMRPFSAIANRARLPLICGPYVPTLIYQPSAKTQSLLHVFVHFVCLFVCLSHQGITKGHSQRSGMQWH